MLDRCDTLPVIVHVAQHASAAHSAAPRLWGEGDFSGSDEWHSVFAKAVEAIPARRHRRLAGHDDHSAKMLKSTLYRYVALRSDEEGDGQRRAS